MPDDDDELRQAPPAVPEWEPSELAARIARGHAGQEHFPDSNSDDLARMIQHVLRVGLSKHYRERTLYWEPELGIVVLVNPRSVDGGTAFTTHESYFAEWGTKGR